MNHRKYLRVSLRFIPVTCMVLSALLVCAQGSTEEKKHRYKPEQFESEARAEWQKVDKVVEALGLEKGACVADIGGGSGYFSRPLAKTVGREGVVYCCDIATNLMEYLQESAKKERLENIVTVFSALDRPMLPPASVDLIFLCNTNHHLDKRVAYYKGLLKNIRPGGRLAVVDWTNKERKVGPPVGHSHARAQVVEEMRQAGWELQKEHTFLDYQYFLVFEPKGK